MTNKEYCEIMDNSNFFIDSANPYDMKIKEALEKQIPKKPIPQDEDCLECPNCDSFIGYESECKEEHYRVEYCPNCGQAIKWE